MRRLFTAFAKNTVFANILLVTICTAGILAVVFLERETFPDIELDMIRVVVPWPGADPEEVEEGICRKIEEAIEGIDGIKRYHTIARENYGIATIEVRDDFDIIYVKEKVRNAVEAISTFPQDAEKPITEEAILRVNVMFIALYGEAMDERLLKEWGEKIREELRALPELSQIELLGTRDYEIAIEVSEERLREYRLTFEEVAEIVRRNSLNLSGGVMRTEGEEIRVRTIGRNYTAEDFAAIVVIADAGGEIITLDRIATIRDAFTEDYAISRFNGHQAVTLGLLRTTEEDALAIDEAVQEYVRNRNETLPEGVNLDIWGRMAAILRARIQLLVRNGFIGLGLVFLILWLFLDIRLSFWAGMGMPVSIMGTLAIMWYIGETINMISLFGLIMVLGIIVDDAIVVGEAIYVARKNGVPPLKAAVDGVMEVGLPVVAAVTTTIVAFVPLAFVGGFMGDLIAILPVIVIAALTISLLECLMLLPAHLSHLPAFNRTLGKGSAIVRFGRRFHHYTNGGLEWFADNVYEPFLGKAMHWRYLSLAVAFMVAMIAAGIMHAGFLKFQLFPEMDGNAISCSIEFPNGTPIEVTAEATRRIEDAIGKVEEQVDTLSGKPLVENIFSVSGAKIDDKGGSIRGNHLGTVRVELLDTGKRGIYFKQILARWEKAIGQIPGVISLTFVGDEIAPPGAPVEVWIQGQDLDRMREASGNLKKRLTAYAGVYQIEDDFRPGKNEIRLRLKPEARALGITTADLARQIYAGYFGEEAVRIQRGRDDIRVRVRYPEEERHSLSDLLNLRIKIRPRQPASIEQLQAAAMQGGGMPQPGAGGMQPGAGSSAAMMQQAAGENKTAAPLYEIPLRSVADITYEPGYANITRTDGMRRIVVTAEVDPARANANEIVSELRRQYLPALEQAFPRVAFSLQGEQEEMRDSFKSLFVGFPIAVLAIFIIIATVFRSYLQPLVILVTVPFGMVGAILGHLLLGYDMSMMSLFGMTALAGIVVNDAIVLIECVNSFIARDEPFMTAVRKGGARRFRAIFLTTISTVGGLTPLIMESDFQAQMLIPMAISIAGGITLATLLTLVLIPCLLTILNDFRRIAHHARTGIWPRREDVEPARERIVE
jgi:multidrug efflux pump subunit AcrB